MSSRCGTQPLSDIGQFYKQVDDFKDKVIHILRQFSKETEIVDLHKYYDKLMTFKKVNVRTPIELFYTQCVTERADKILTRDESFFLSEVSKIKNDSDQVTSKDIFFIYQIKQIWEQLQPSVKNNIWTYVQVICILAEKIVGGNVLATRKKVLLEHGSIN